MSALLEASCPQEALETTVRLSDLLPRLKAAEAWDLDHLLDPEDLKTGRPITKLARKLRECSTSAWLCRGSNGTLRVAIARCKSRICPTCHRLRSKRTFSKTLAVVEKMDSPRFITLTLQAEHRPLRDSLTALRKAFRKLRTHERWKRAVKFGVSTTEVTYNPKQDTWHVHAHCIVEGDYLDVSHLSEMWRWASKTSYVVDIRQCYSRKKLSGYISSYIAKGASPTNMPAQRTLEWAMTMHGLRCSSTFGKPPRVPPRAKTEHFERIISLPHLAAAGRAGDAEAASLLRECLDLLYHDHAAPDLHERCTAWQRHKDQPPDHPAPSSSQPQPTPPSLWETLSSKASSSPSTN